VFRVTCRTDRGARFEFVRNLSKYESFARIRLTELAPLIQSRDSILAQKMQFLRQGRRSSLGCFDPFANISAPRRRCTRFVYVRVVKNYERHFAANAPRDLSAKANERQFRATWRVVQKAGL